MKSFIITTDHLRVLYSLLFLCGSFLSLIVSLRMLHTNKSLEN